MRLLSAGLTRQHVEATLIRYLISFLTIALNIILVVAILGYFGLETTSFAALIAAQAWRSARWAGLFVQLRRRRLPAACSARFKVGDYILGAASRKRCTNRLFTHHHPYPGQRRDHRPATPRSSATTSRTTRPTPIGAWSSWRNSPTASIRPTR